MATNKPSSAPAIGSLEPGIPKPARIVVWCWSLNDTPAREGWLSGDERRRANRFHFAADRRRFVAAHTGLRGLLAIATGGHPAGLRLRTGEFGKPSIDADPTVAAPGKPMHFNLSHSGELAAVAVSTAGEVGVDVERHREVDQWEAIAERHFTRAEADGLTKPTGLAASNAADRRQRFFNLWTGKEAVVKLLGAGLSFPLTAFETPGATAATGWITLPSDNPLRLERCWLERLPTDKLPAAAGYSLAVATSAQPAGVACRAVRLADVVARFAGEGFTDDGLADDGLAE